ncbi:unnamed protein product [Urochloa humidicola]
MAAGAASSRSLAAATCLLAVLFAGCLLAAALPTADARRLLAASPGMAPAPAPGADDHAGRMLFEGMAPAPAPGADDDRAGRILFEGGGRALLGGGLRLAGRLLLGIGL